jgi:hypothetical protein
MEASEVVVFDEDGDGISYRIESHAAGYHGCPLDDVVRISAMGGDYSMAPSSKDCESAVIPLRLLREFVNSNPGLFAEARSGQ